MLCRSSASGRRLGRRAPILRRKWQLIRDDTCEEDRIMAHRLNVIGVVVARYGLVIVLLWIGAMKFTAYEAEGIKPLVANSPLMSWIYEVMSVRAFAAVLGVIEIGLGVLIAVRPLWPIG